MINDNMFRRANSRHARILTEISLGDYFVGFLSSARNTKLLYTVARERAVERSRNMRTITELEKRGYVARKEKGGKPCFLVTPQGRHALHEVGRETTRTIAHPTRWDGKWRVLIYDFPEQARSTRNTLRYALERIGFLFIQKSVWIFPYDAPLLSALLAKDKDISEAAIFMIANSIENDAEYREHFHLPQIT